MWGALSGGMQGIFHRKLYLWQACHHILGLFVLQEQRTSQENIATWSEKPDRLCLLAAKY